MSSATRRVVDWFEAHRNRPPMLRAFVQRMPKGGDIHTHLSGAVYAERYLQWAAELNYCLEAKTDRLIPPPCDDVDGNRLAKEVLANTDVFNTLVDRLSTRNLAYSGRSGYDQFFATFREFGPVSSQRGDDMLASVANRAATQHIFYLEVMLTFQGKAIRNLGRRLGWEGDLALTRQRLLDHGLRDLVGKGVEDIATLSSEYRKILKCGTPAANPGCDVTVRYLQQTTRTGPPEQVFAQLVFAFELAQADPRVVGINLVAPEHDPVALRDYTLHMQMLDFVHRQERHVKISLHAGELTLGLVPPRELRFHIRQAIEIGQAHRIGHGVAVFYEDRPFELMAEMKERRVLVEICLTSNDVILELKGDDHPFPDYLRAGVPVTLASDDEGIARIDLSNEYLRAALSYDLSYPDLKRLARNSLEYSFLAGKSLWRTTDLFTVVDACADAPPGSVSPSETCTEFLRGSDRASEQWRLEAEFVKFEGSPWLR